MRDGKVILCNRCPCGPEYGDICVQTQNFQHNHCIDLTMTNDRMFTENPDYDPLKYSKCYNVSGEPGEFEVKVRWNSNHFPYPEIDKMSVWVFGKKVESNTHMPCACDGGDYKTVAHVKIKNNGAIYINGEFSGHTTENDDDFE